MPQSRFTAVRERYALGNKMKMHENGQIARSVEENR